MVKLSRKQYVEEITRKICSRLSVHNPELDIDKVRQRVQQQFQSLKKIPDKAQIHMLEQEIAKDLGITLPASENSQFPSVTKRLVLTPLKSAKAS